jgi:proline dehydrogenase
MGVIDEAVVGTARVVPKPILRRIAYRYIAGETLEEALETVSRLNASGCAATIDLLGEGVTDRARVLATLGEYQRMLAEIGRRALRAGVSVKLSSFGLGVDEALCREGLAGIVARAADLGRFVRVDMEGHRLTEATIRMALEVHRAYPNVGVVVQAYLRRSAADVVRLLESGMSVRLCKGIYDEPRHLAYKDFDLVRANYLYLLERLLRGDPYVAIATHDEYLVWHALRLLGELGRPRDTYEFQMLLGVDEELRGMLVEEGHRVRVYVPYGRDWHAYSLRRLRENPRIARSVAQGVLRRSAAPTPR